MAFYIESNCKPVNDKTFATVADVIAFATAPRYAGDVRNVQIINETTFKEAGTIYKIVAGENPSAARQEAKSAVAAPRASAAQVRYIITLRDQVPASAYDVITGRKALGSLSTAEASAIISRLKSIAVR